MIAEPPPFYVRFLRSVFSPERRLKHRTVLAESVTVPQSPVRLLPKPETRLLEQPATALKALPSSGLVKPDVLALPDRDQLRSVVPDFDHLEYGTDSMSLGGCDA